MKSLFTKLMVVAALALPVLSVACNDDDGGTDTSNGKTISDLDISGDVTLNVGESQQATAILKYADGTTLDVSQNADTTWNTDNPDVATVSKTGMVMGVKVGVTKITATYQGKADSDHSVIVK